MNSISQNGYRGLQAPLWWQVVPAEEQQVLRNFMRMMGGMKRSRRPRVARAAAKWERRLRCFIKVRLMHERRRLKGVAA